MSTRLVAPRLRHWVSEPAVARRLLQGVVIASVIAASALFALVAASERIDVRLVFAAALAAVGGVYLLRQSRAGAAGVLLILGTAGLANIVTLPTGSDSRLVISLLLAMGFTALWLLQMLVRKEIRLLPSPLNAPVLAWCGVSILAYVWSKVFIDPLVFVPRSFVFVQLAALLVNILLPLQSLYVVNQVGALDYATGIRWLRRIVALVLAIGAFAIASELLHLPLTALFSNGTRGLFAMWVFGLALALFLYDATLGPAVRLALLALMGAWFYRAFIVDTAWLSGWLPMGAAAAVIFFLRSKRLFAAFALLVLTVAIFNAQEIYLSVVVSNVEEGSTSRLDLWSVALSYLARHPLLGMGPAGYAVYYMTYNPFDARSTHNNLFDVTAQAGIIGLGVFLWLGSTAFRMAFRLTRALRGERTFESALAAAATGGVVGAFTGMLLGDWVLPFAYNQTISGFDNAVFTWVLIGCAGALAALRTASGGRPA